MLKEKVAKAVEQKAELVPLPGIERELKQLELDVKTAATAYEFIDKEFKEADIKLSYAVPEVRLVSQAEPPRLPSSPLRGTIALVSLLGGLVVGIGLALFLVTIVVNAIARLMVWAVTRGAPGRGAISRSCSGSRSDSWRSRCS